MSALVASTRAALDPDLPELDEVLSPRPPGVAAGNDCRIRHVDWSPRQRCRVVHEVRGGPAPTFVVSEVTPAGSSTRPMCPDPALPGLPTALDLARVRARLAAVDAAAVLSGPPVPIAYRPGSRAVVAYDLTGPGGPARLFAKLLATGPARSATACTAIAEAARRRGEPVPVPEVVAVWPDLGAVVQTAAPGRGLSRMLTQASAASGRRAVRRLGRLLAGVHATPSTGAEPLWTSGDELAQLESLLAPTWHADPAVGRALAAVLDRLADRTPGEGELVLAHGAFRTGQVLVARGRLRLLDLDTVARSDPARDIGNAIAYLTWAGLRGALGRAAATAMCDALVVGYADVSSLPDSRMLRWWTAAAAAKIAGRRYRTLAYAEWSLVPQLLAVAADLLGSAPVHGTSAGGAVAANGSSDSSARAADRCRMSGFRADTGTVPGWSGPSSTGSRKAGPDGDPLLDPILMTAALRTVLPQAGSVAVLEARALAVAAGRRLVVRYMVEGLERDGPIPVIGKAHASRHRAAAAEQNLRLLDAEFAGFAALGVPRTVCRIPNLQMVLYREVTGPSLDAVTGPSAARGAEAAGRWLATLHASGAILTRRADLGHEIAEAANWAAAIAAAAPHAGPSAIALAHRLAEVATRQPAHREVPVHRDLHAGHVLLPHGEGGGVVVIDLDEARMGDPAADVAHFCAYLDAAGRLDHAALRDAFLTAYGPLPGAAPELRVALHAGRTALKIAKQLASGSGPLRPGGTRARAAALDAALARGWACLPA